MALQETKRCTTLEHWILGSLWIGSGCAAEQSRGVPWIPPPAGEDEGDDDDHADDGGEDTSTGPADPDPMVDDGAHDHGSESGGSEDHGELESSGGAPPESPYQGGWDIGTCQDAIVATHNGAGGVLADFSVGDQFGDSVRLYDFCHKAILLTDGSFW